MIDKRKSDTIFDVIFCAQMNAYENYNVRRRVNKTKKKSILFITTVLLQIQKN